MGIRHRAGSGIRKAQPLMKGASRWTIKRFEMP